MDSSLHALVCDRIYAGNTEAANDIDLLDQLGITAVINLSDKKYIGLHEVYDFALSPCELLQSEIQKMQLKLASIITQLTKLYNNSGRLFIFCNDGRNRSLLVAGCFLVSHGHKYQDVINKLEMLYMSADQRAHELRERERIDAELDGKIILMSAEESARIASSKESRNELRGLTNKSFAKIIRLNGGAKK